MGNIVEKYGDAVIRGLRPADVCETDDAKHDDLRNKKPFQNWSGHSPVFSSISVEDNPRPVVLVP